MDQSRAPLYEAVVKYTEREMVPFHMPGHTCGKGAPLVFKDFFGKEFFKFDLTEVSGLDYLHYAHGVIREAEELAADLYKTRSTFFLVNGTTSGIHAMILSTLKKGEKIIIGRNSHRSVVGGIILSGAIPIFVQPAYNEDFGIITNITPLSLERAIKENPDTKAVLITTPNYYGLQGRIERMIELSHSHNLVVLVDEAHGAHFPFHPLFPKSAIEYGADAVVQSAHKTLPTLTQTSLLHIVSERLKRDKVEQILGVIETSSPSYIFMTIMDVMRREMALNGKELWNEAVEVASYAREEISKIPGFRVITEEIVNGNDINAFDPIKLTINVEELGYSGFEVEAYLNENNIEIELSDLRNVLLFVTIGIEKKDVDQLIAVLRDLQPREKKDKERIPSFPEAGIQVLSPSDAFNSDYEVIKLRESVGRVSWGFVSPYPPGIPVLVPGMEITEEEVHFIEVFEKRGAMVQGPIGKVDGIYVRVVKDM